MYRISQMNSFDIQTYTQVTNLKLQNPALKAILKPFIDMFGLLTSFLGLYQCRWLECWGQGLLGYVLDSRKSCAIHQIGFAIYQDIWLRRNRYRLGM